MPMPTDKTSPKPNQPESKPIAVRIRQINTAMGMTQNSITSEVEQTMQFIGLGDDDRIYLYNITTKKWHLA